MSIVAIIGRKRSGKDTIANHLIDNFGYTRYGLADPIKKAVCNIFGWDFDFVERPENKEMVDPRYGISYRQALQHLGTDWGQLALCEAYPDFKMVTGRTLWVKRFIQEAYNSPNPKWVISDVRFHHEVNTLQIVAGHETKFIKVERPSLTYEEDTHYSERDIDNLEYDHLIINDGTIEDLENKVDEFITSL